MMQTKLKNDKNETVKAGCVIINDNGKVLLISNIEKKIWAFPKGHSEFGETLEQTAIRETKEETGYKVKIVKRLPDLTYGHTETGEQIRVALFKAEIIGEPEKAEKGTCSKWFTINKAKEIVYKNLKPVLNNLE